jgi:hypothetical protein
MDSSVHHIVAVYGDEAMRLYIDGVVMSEIPSARGLTDNDAPLRIGRSMEDGVIDEVAIYPVALSVERIQRHHEVGSGR